jgi:sensor domain CHASE-containing protein
VARPGNLAYLAAWLCLQGGSDRAVQAILEQRSVEKRLRQSLELVEREVQVRESERK